MEIGHILNCSGKHQALTDIRIHQHNCATGHVFCVHSQTEDTTATAFDQTTCQQ